MALSRLYLLLPLATLVGCKGDCDVKDIEDTGDSTDTGYTDTIQVSMELLGKLLYMDPNLSNPPGQSCAACHSADAAFVDPDKDSPTSEGVVPGLFGNRNSPSAAYAAYSPDFHFDEEEGMYVGGQFWDGRAVDLAEQARGPFVNPVEMNNTEEGVVSAVAASEYADLFEAVFGAGSVATVDTAYVAISEAIAAYESSAEVNRFTSKYDSYLAGDITLSEQEARGLDLFNDAEKAMCAECHPSESTDSNPPMFTDFTYDNLGVPRNPDNPFYGLSADYNPDGAEAIDLGLGGFLDDPAENGKFKVPTLRNIAKTGPYMHNGIFDTLEDVVRFYSTRDVDSTWGDPEVAENMNTDELGDLGLTDQEVEDIVVFLETLTDGYVP